jgi:hypothetical protein
MRLFSRPKKLFVFAAFVLTLMLSGFLHPSSSSAKTATRTYVYYSEEIDYYSDASYTTQVGTGIIYCNGHSTLTGHSTQYRIETELDTCCYGVPC